jgi:hypothetical protein
MLLKMLIVRFLPYLAGAGLFSMVAHRDVPSLVATPRFTSHQSSRTDMFSGQVVDRSGKSEKIMIRRETHHADDRDHEPQLVMSPKLGIKADCKRPLDVPGRCFSDALSNCGTS